MGIIRTVAALLLIVYLGANSDRLSRAYSQPLHDHAHQHDISAASIKYSDEMDVHQRSPLAGYTITDLGAFVPNRIGNNGVIVGGIVASDGHTHAAEWQSGTVTDLGVLRPGDDTDSFAIAVNRYGEVVGNSWNRTNPSDYQHAFLWSGGSMHDIGASIDPVRLTFAKAINDQDVVVGQSELFYAGYLHSYSYHQGQTSLLSFGNNQSDATSINQSNAIAGSLAVQITSVPPSHWLYHATIWSAGVSHDLGTLPGTDSSQATSINNSDDVVGTSFNWAQCGTKAFLFDGTMHDLGGLGGNWTGANDINDAGFVVGNSFITPYPCADANYKDPAYGYTGQPIHAFLYNGGSMYDLNSFLPANSGWLLLGASSINNSGMIVGTGWYKDSGHGYLLTPVDSNTCTVGQYFAQYYANPDLSGTPTFVRCEAAPLGLESASAPPAPAIPYENWSARFIGMFQFTSGNYTFRTSSNDSTRLWLDGRLTIDTWSNRISTPIHSLFALSSGSHSVHIEYSHRSGGYQLSVQWAHTCANEQYTAEYYTNTELHGLATMIKCESSPLNAIWGPRLVSPAGANNWSALYYGHFRFAAGKYLLVSTADDGVQVYIDGKLVIDDWKIQYATTKQATFNVNGGLHTITVRYFQATGAAQLAIHWRRSG